MHVGVEIGFEIVMRRHLVDLAAFFVEAQPPALAVGEVILDEGQPGRIAVNKKLTGGVIEPVFT